MDSNLVPGSWPDQSTCVKGWLVHVGSRRFQENRVDARSKRTLRLRPRFVDVHSMLAATRLQFPESVEHDGWPGWDVIDACSDRVCDCVRHRCNPSRGSHLSSALGAEWTPFHGILQKDCRDRPRGVLNRRQSIVPEGAGLAGNEGFLERIAESHQHTSVDLSLQALAVDNGAHISGVGYVPHFDLPCVG